MKRTTMVEPEPRAWLPYPHVMGGAPLDVWFRLLCRPPVRVPLRYWPRLLGALCTSAMSTLLTLPERIMFALWWRWQRPAGDTSPPPVFVLGYYRSGTTHLQYLLDCDPQLYSPQWAQTLAPQGFVLSWSLLRALFIPFMPATRPVDALAFGPDVPSEDDFALCNWALASSLPGRSVVPHAHRFYDRFHDLRALTPAERARWSDYQLAFTHKLTFVARGRRLLLKTPSHTARLETLLELFPGAKFIHITRHPQAVLRSNMTLASIVLRRYALQPALPADEMQDHLASEYLGTERRYLAMRSQVPPGQLAEIRFQDLLADPLGEIRRVYATLGLPFAAAFERRLLAYLDFTRNYAGNLHADWTDEQTRQHAPLVAFLSQAFGHNRPAIPMVTPPRPPDRPRAMTAAFAAAVAAVAAAVVWLTLAQVTLNRHDSFVWPTGIIIGYATHRAAGRGDTRLGVWAVLLTVGVLLCIPFFNSWTLQHAGHSAFTTNDVWRTTVHHLGTPAHLFWIFMGLATAYRVASRRWP